MTNNEQRSWTSGIRANRNSNAIKPSRLASMKSTRTSTLTQYRAPVCGCRITHGSKHGSRAPTTICCGSQLTRAAASQSYRSLSWTLVVSMLIRLRCATSSSKITNSRTNSQRPYVLCSTSSSTKSLTLFVMQCQRGTRTRTSSNQKFLRCGVSS